jgi:hypothetical protein
MEKRLLELLTELWLENKLAISQSSAINLSPLAGFPHAL